MKRLLVTIRIFALLPIVFFTQTKTLTAQASKPNEEIVQLNTAITNYFSTVASIAGDPNNQPAYKNAANGIFAIRVSKISRSIYVPNFKFTNLDAQLLYNAFIAFSIANESKFIEGPQYNLKHKCSGGTCSQAFLDYFPAIKDAILSISKIISSQGSDATAYPQLINSVSSILGTTRGKKYAIKGQNASGIVSLGVNTGARNGSNEIAKLSVMKDFDSNTYQGKVALTLQGCFKELLKLRTDNHQPWLRPEWQVQYYAIMSATADKLRAIN